MSSSSSNATATATTTRPHCGHRRPRLPVRQRWSIILCFGMAILLGFYNILTAPTVEQPTSQRELTLQPATFPHSENEYAHFTLSTDEANQSVSIQREESLNAMLTIREQLENYLSTNDPPLPPHTPGAFIHVGKTGGSTLSLYQKNACHSFVRKPCRRNPANESYIFKTTTYSKSKRVLLPYFY
jgi:hypothetical protein